MLLRLARAIDRLRQAAQKRRWNPDAATGRRGEDIAHRFLQEKGYAIVARNLRLPGGRGEIDLIARRGGELAFVEVKTRRSAEFGDPERAIDREKRLAMIRAAKGYALRAGLDESAIRFDVVSIVAAGDLTVRHIENVFPFR